MIVYRVTNGYRVNIEKVNVDNLTDLAVTPKGGRPIHLTRLDEEFFFTWREALAYAEHESGRYLEKAKAASECLRAGISRLRQTDAQKLKVSKW